MTALDVRTVSSYADLIGDDDLPFDAADAISAALAAENKVACWVPDFIAQDPSKTLPGYHNHPNVLVGTIENETEKGVLIQDPATGDEDWYPKTRTIVYTAGPDSDFYVSGGA